MITTKYIGPTNTHGACIVATGGGHQVTIPFDLYNSSFECHLTAAKVLARRFRWTGMTYAAEVGSNGFVFLNSESTVSVD